MPANQPRPEGDRVKVLKLRRELGLTHREITERTGIPRGTVSDIIRRDRARQAQVESGVDKTGPLPSWAR